MQIRKEAYGSVTNKFVMKLTRNWQFFLKKNTLAVNSQKLLYMYMRTFIIIALYIMIRNETITRSSYHHSKGTTCRPHCSKFVVLGLKGEQKTTACDRENKSCIHVLYVNSYSKEQICTAIAVRVISELESENHKKFIRSFWDRIYKMIKPFDLLNIVAEINIHMFCNKVLNWPVDRKIVGQN